ncbi:MAG: DUF4404 family protein [Pirellulales bacterium]
MRQTLDETLSELHQQLASAKELDEAQRIKLRQALEEIQQTLDNSQVSSASLATQLKQAVAQFENSHPQLTNSIGRIADLLSQMGI